MKGIILLLVLAVAVGFAVTASAGSEICWNFNNPYGTDTIRALLDDDDAVIASWIIRIGSGNDPLLIPMVGTMQKDLNGRMRLSLHGTARDLSFSAPFIFDCILDATLDKHTLNSVQIAPTGGSDLHSSVLAGCNGYFDPDNPFTTNDTLTKVSCKNFPNPTLK